MGVPTFFKWLSTKYPLIVKDVIEGSAISYTKEGQKHYVQLENPNGVFDNLYLDLNGIIHMCTHPPDENESIPEKEMVQRIFQYIDRLMDIIKPRKLLFIAIDGVAPRAKMSQQRSRRYKNQADILLEEELYTMLREEFEKDGKSVPSKPYVWDSNVITPGTQFLDKISTCLKYYVNNRFASNVLWKNLSVILSDSNSPGEGEHKIMQYIRSQRTYAGYNPNEVHCIHGSDADLIMLGLATHEPNFFIIREAVTDPFSQVKCNLCQMRDHSSSECPFAQNDNGTITIKLPENFFWKPLQLLSIGVLREYLSVEFSFKDKPNFKCDIEKCIDDFVLICFFVGNDFLPSLPSLGIEKGSIDQMILLYQKIRPLLSKPLCDGGYINLTELQRFISYLGQIEENVFKSDQKFQERINKAKAELNANTEGKKNFSQNQYNEEYIDNTEDSNFAESRRLKKMLLDELKKSEDTSNQKYNSDEFHRKCIDEFKTTLRNLKKQKTEVQTGSTKIQLESDPNGNWKRNYYITKFNLDRECSEEELENLIKKISNLYVEGLRWILLYYYQGIASWAWVYNYHYPPFSSDVATYGFSNQKPFVLGSPFKPFEQLVSIIPPKSAHILPQPYYDYMTNSNSTLIDYFPRKFKEDPFGKRYRWQWVSLLPFIDEDVLLNEIAPLEKYLNDEEKSRNKFRHCFLIVNKSSNVSKLLEDVQREKKDDESSCDNTSTCHIKGKLTYSDMGYCSDDTLTFTCSGEELYPEMKSSTVCCGFTYQPLFEHKSVLLPGAQQLKYNINEHSFIQENSKNRRFNSIPAKRMIMNALHRAGVVSNDEMDTFLKDVNNTNNNYQKVHSDNRYSSEMFNANTLGENSRRNLDNLENNTNKAVSSNVSDVKRYSHDNNNRLNASPYHVHTSFNKSNSNYASTNQNDQKDPYRVDSSDFEYSKTSNVSNSPDYMRNQECKVFDTKQYSRYNNTTQFSEQYSPDNYPLQDDQKLHNHFNSKNYVRPRNHRENKGFTDNRNCGKPGYIPEQQFNSNVPCSSEVSYQPDNKHSTKRQYDQQRHFRPNNQYDPQRHFRPNNQYDHQRQYEQEGQYRQQRQYRPEGQYRQQRQYEQEEQYRQQRQYEQEGQYRQQRQYRPERQFEQEGQYSQQKQYRSEGQYDLNTQYDSQRHVYNQHDRTSHRLSVSQDDYEHTEYNQKNINYLNSRNEFENITLPKSPNYPINFNLSNACNFSDLMAGLSQKKTNNPPVCDSYTVENTVNSQKRPTLPVSNGTSTLSHPPKVLPSIKKTLMTKKFNQDRTSRND